MTTATFKYLDPTSYDPNATAPFKKPWGKVDGPGTSFRLVDHKRTVTDIRPTMAAYNSVDGAGFAVYEAPSIEKAFTDDKAVREGYYAEVEALLKQKQEQVVVSSGSNSSSSGGGGGNGSAAPAPAPAPKVKKVVIFDHTIRRRDKTSPRQPVQQVHVDQTPRAAEARVRRHVAASEADELLKGRYQIINVWRPIEKPASDFPLAVVDYRSTSPSDFVKVDLLYPKHGNAVQDDDDDDDRGKEALPDPASVSSTAGYEVKGETYGVAPSDNHRFLYLKDMRPDEVMFIKCFDSRSEWYDAGNGVAHCTPHTAFVDPLTPADAPGRQSIEVRCLVFYE